MRIRSIELSWFRGAGAKASLEPNGRSMVVYGSNGSGKSSFVDALEYALSGGRVEHLAHEYSGRNQERGVLNTHKPEDVPGEVSITFTDGTIAAIRIGPNGSYIVEGSGEQHLKTWDRRRTVLRQDEVSRFIHSTKGEKYSVLLPLLGLGQRETTAENLRHLAAAVAKASGAKEAAGALRGATSQLSSVYGANIPASADAGIKVLCEAYVHQVHDHSSDRCADLVALEIDNRLKDAAELQRTQLTVERLAMLDIKAAITGVREAASSLALVADSLLRARLDVLESSLEYLNRTQASGRVECPACGSSVERDAFQSHVEGEMGRLRASTVAAKQFEDKRRALSHLVQQGIELCTGELLTKWSQAQGGTVAASIQKVAQLSALSDEVREDELRSVEECLLPAVVAAASAAAFLPSPATELAVAKTRLQAALALLSAEQAVATSRKGDQLAAHIRVRESGIRDEIRKKGRKIVEEISGDIQGMWQILHPGELIEDVTLRIPEETDKAIDISLKFYGKDLESPRLTLSEGYRNSLGLCVFLAMAARDAEADTPIVLDDVIVSLDRGHRGMVAELIQSEFSGRQVVLLTHDRDWFAELRRQLPDWGSSSLLPYQSPETGISCSKRRATFDDARKYLTDRPDTAANEARKIMDVELAIIAEGLDVELPFRRGERADKRTAHEFLEKIVAKAKKNYKASERDKALADLEVADKLLITWANRGSHGDDLVQAEAAKLIDACEKALAAFSCANCGKSITFAGTPEGKQCKCGSLQWR